MAKQTDKIRLQELAHKWLTGTISREEQQEFDNWFNQTNNDAPISVPDLYAPNEDAHKKQLYANILNRIDDRRPRRKIIKWLPYAAAMVTAIAAVAWYFAERSPTSKPVISPTYVQDVAPGGNRAMLTLADGEKINLSEAQSGIVVSEDGVAYQDDQDQSKEIVDLTSGVVSQMMLTTPRGGTYKLRLSDGTTVWLNAASTLKYPSKFTGATRVVELEGEGYFEVSKSAVPFKVKSQGQEVEVLGTAFNLSSYSNQSETKTTLVEGRVKVTLLDGIISNSAESSHILEPGQQITKIGSVFSLQSVDTETYTAWKDGYFDFDGITPTAAFSQLERWYDIDVVYQGKAPTMVFFGMFRRDKPLISVLDMLKESGLDFKVTTQGERKQLIVINE